jgi:hypothetical protein
LADGDFSLPDYLVSYGSSGGFGRFAADEPIACRRGETVVVQSCRGLELGVVLCEATAEHARLLPAAAGGQLLRRATRADEQARQQLRDRERQLFEECRQLVEELNLSLEVLDVELLLDGRQLIVQYLAADDGEAAALVNKLTGRHDLTVRLENLALPTGLVEEESGGCGKPGCGRARGGSGCSECGSGGGCASCGSGVDLRAYFAHLRTQMEQHQRRPLL